LISRSEAPRCKRGDFVGEMAFMSGGTATATVITSSPTRFLHAALQNMNENLMDKLMEQRDRSRAAMA
jgi:CRP-like cAMP-binding protein